MHPPYKVEWASGRVPVVNGIMLEIAETPSGGISRHYTDYARFFLKIDGLRYRQAEHEWIIWKMMDKDDRQWFNTAYAYGEFDDARWILKEYLHIPYCDDMIGTYGTYAWDRCESIVNGLCEKYRLSDMNCPANWVIIDDRPLILDYGIAKSDWEFYNNRGYMRGEIIVREMQRQRQHRRNR
jgi:hypothetical protein